MDKFFDKLDAIETKAKITKEFAAYRLEGALLHLKHILETINDPAYKDASIELRVQAHELHGISQTLREAEQWHGTVAYLRKEDK